MEKKDQHRGEASSDWNPVCTSRETPTACCTILDSITDGVLAVDRNGGHRVLRRRMDCPLSAELARALGPGNAKH